MIRSILARFRRKPSRENERTPVIVPRDELTPEPLRFNDDVMAWLRNPAQSRPPSIAGRQNPFLGLPDPPPGVRPRTDPPPRGMAMDEAPGVPSGGAWGAWAQQGLWGEGLWFPGYPYLAELAQRPEYRNMVGTLAEECTRKWIKIVSRGKTDKTPKVESLERSMIELSMRQACHPEAHGARGRSKDCGAKACGSRAIRILPNWRSGQNTATWSARWPKNAQENGSRSSAGEKRIKPPRSKRWNGR